MLRQADFVDRNNFADFLNRRGLAGEAVEIGTHRAEFAWLFLENWRGRKLWCVDPWVNPPGYEEQAAQLANSNGDRAKDHKQARANLFRFKGRVEMLVLTSEEAVVGFDKNSLDFVYIDGDHRQEHVAADLERWWPVVKSGGILAGHDFVTHGGHDEGVQPAVLQFQRDWRIRDLWIVTEPLCLPWSFYFVKD